jgi:type I restriction-modification system DNA methylase subunit
VDAYLYIRDELRELGWDTRHPGRHPGGQVYTQAECLSDSDIKTALGLERPENIVRVSDSVLWVIEAKRDHRHLAKALKEAQDYAKKINAARSSYCALFVTGIAGNSTDTFLTASRYWNGTRFIPITINGQEITSLMSPDIAERILAQGHPVLADIQINEELFLSKAERINQILHLGAINKNYRARVMAALLLALLGKTQPDVDSDPMVLVEDINARVRHILDLHHKRDFFDYIRIALPTTSDNHIKFKTALVKTIRELNNLNIRSAMNSGHDVLGKFYEVFLKYGNGAKEIGIVLTPRHITKFAVEAMGVSDRDIVFDPTCGTAGFLVAALDHVRRNCSDTQIQRFQKDNLFGVEQEAEVVALAIVNMVFRGDGKNNIVEGNVFRKNLHRQARGGNVSATYSARPPKDEELAVTRVLMNPPFALKASDEKEFRFIDHALKQMESRGLLFCVLPYGAMVKPGEYLQWRKNLITRHTLCGVVTFPEDLFYPIGVHTVGVFVEKGIPHPKDQPVLWVRAVRDGLLKNKGKRLPNPRAANDLEEAQKLFRHFLREPLQAVIPIERRICSAPIDQEDPLLELVPENYLPEMPPTPDAIVRGMEEVIRDTMAFQLRGEIPNEP